MKRPRRILKPLLAASICSVLILIFTCIAWSSARRESPTADEPNHMVVGWFMLWQKDFRLSPDVPPLWEDWIALGMGNSLHYDSHAPAYLTNPVNLISWCDLLLYKTPGVNGIVLMNRARDMSLLWGVALAIVIAKWSWDVGGPVAAVAATLCYCCDPNFLGHAPLAKNDVAAALMFAATAYSIWRAGRKLTWLNGAAVVILTSAAVLVKLSGLMLPPVIVILLGFRILSFRPWPILSRTIRKPRYKLLSAAILCAITALVAWGGLWACYDFRFDSGPNGMQLDLDRYERRLRNNLLARELNRDPTPAETDAWKAPISTHAILLLAHRHLIPQAFAAGFLHTQNEDAGRHRSYLFGQIYEGGKWYYFPLAVYFKEPLGMLAGVGLSLLAILIFFPSWLTSPERRWAAAVLFVPAAFYLTAAITSELNIGVRHIFPVFPFVFIAAGLGAARLWRTPAFRFILPLLAIGFATETVLAYPHYVSFLNVTVSSMHPPPLSDSNIDWGQDLPLLAHWQKEHPNVPLYLDYFGHCDPAIYGVHATYLADAYSFGHPTANPSAPGMIAVSTTLLYQLYDNGQDKLTAWGLWPKRKPDKLLDRSINLFTYPPPAK